MKKIIGIHNRTFYICDKIMFYFKARVSDEKKNQGNLID